VAECVVAWNTKDEELNSFRGHFVGRPGAGAVTRLWRKVSTQRGKALILRTVSPRKSALNQSPRAASACSVRIAGAPR